VVRAQIDRLTPWTANDAAFGWSAPAEAGADRVVITVAATARAMVQPIVDALVAAGAEAVTVSAAPPDAAPITVFEHRASGTLEAARVRRTLVAVLIVTGLLAGVSLSIAGLAGMKLAGEQDELTRRIADRRMAIRLGRESGPVATPLRALERRKYQSPSSVIVLEALSQILPDHTYVTELRIEGDKLRVIGITRDAPSLIRLMEQSPNFTRATFFAPTTKGPSDPGERFHIEAQIEPVFVVRS
jgi:general secretion pathway protein L